ncbi:MAG: hypothetical protein JNJ73_12690 [Hyphomonadaceae bacterium]|nr:hypothetical protein [Hyphomonadaceae bacterium]
MKHWIEVDVGVPPPDDEHRVRNFIEDVWLHAHKAGWVANLDFLGLRSSEMWRFGFEVAARQSRNALDMIEGRVRHHMMENVAMVRHVKRRKADG